MVRVTLIVLCVATSVTVHTPAQSTARDAASAFFTALKKGDWRGAARLADPDALREARDTELGMLANWAEVRPDLVMQNESFQGVSYGGELDPTLIEKHRDFVVDLFGVRTLGEVAALSPEELFARTLEATYLVPPEGSGERLHRSYRILGVVQETDAVAHILYRATSPDIEYTDPWHAHLLRAIRRADRWLVRPDREIMMFSGTSILFSRLHDQIPPE